MTGSDDQHGQGDAGPDLKHLSLLWALPHHAAAIAALHARAFDEAWDAKAVKGLLDNPGSIALLASDGTPLQIGGFVMAQVAADEAEILSIAVVPEWRRRGVALRLLQGAMRGAARSGARTLFLEVAASNAAAIQLYAKSGFVEAGRREGYYVRHGGQREDAVVMRCELPQGGQG